MTPQREKEIRELVNHPVKFPTFCFLGFERKLFEACGELLDEVSSLRESVRIYGGHCGRCNRLTAISCECGFREVYLKAITKDARTEDHINPPSEPRGIRGSK